MSARRAEKETPAAVCPSRVLLIVLRVRRWRRHHVLAAWAAVSFRSVRPVLFAFKRLPLLRRKDMAQSQQHPRVGLLQFGASLRHPVDLRQNFSVIGVGRLVQRLPNWLPLFR